MVRVRSFLYEPETKHQSLQWKSPVSKTKNPIDTKLKNQNYTDRLSSYQYHEFISPK
jgi:hypothetical protein